MRALPQPDNVLPFELPEQTKMETPRLVDYSLSDKPRPLATSANLAALLSFYGWKAAYNDMTAEPALSSSSGKGRVGGSDSGQYSKLIDACERHNVPRSVIEDHLIALCQDNNFHPVRQWLECGEPWDGVERVNNVIDTLNAKDPEFARSVMRAWLVASVAALYEPTFICKLVPVLQGGQSFKKSAWVRRLADVVSGAHYEGGLNPANVDDVRQATNSWIVELAELESTTKHDAGILKAFITKPKDTYRVPFAKHFTYKNRQTVFIGTVNGTDFLKDQTGNTRFAVIELAEAVNIDHHNDLLGWGFYNERVTQVDPEKLRQFWLEVKALYTNGESWGLDEASQKKQAQANDVHTDKGAHYKFIVDQHLGGNLTAMRWFTAGELTTWHGEQPSKSSMWGKALKQLALEGCIESQVLRGRKTQYRLPVGDTPAHMIKNDNFNDIF